MHKAYVYVDSADEAGQELVAATVTEVIAVYGVRVLVRGEEAQLQAVQAAGYQVEPAEDTSYLALSHVVIDTTAEPTRALAAPGWHTAAAVDEPVYWLIQFVGPMLPEWVAAVARPAPRWWGC